jgi:hypothetical protein
MSNRLRRPAATTGATADCAGPNAPVQDASPALDFLLGLSVEAVVDFDDVELSDFSVVLLVSDPLLLTALP